MTELDGMLRTLVPEVLGILVRRTADFDTAEDAVQEALLAATVQWPAQGVPENPRGWLLTVATRRHTDLIRAEAARRRRELKAATLVPPAAPDDGDPVDDTLMLLFLCCHPALTEASQVALTLRAVGGLTTGEVAAAFLVPEATMTRRISRAKQQIGAADVTAGTRRLGPVLHVLYLIFNAGYTDPHRTDLAGEAIRLTRQVHRLRPDDGEAAGLLALMLLLDARRAARTGDGRLVALAEQDRTRWDRGRIAEGTDLLTRTLPRSLIGPFQIQAAIAAVHAEAPGTAETDWPQILQLYALLHDVAPNPVVTLNRAVALAEVHGPRAALRLLSTLDDDERMAGGHRLSAVRAHLLERAGDAAGAADAYRRAFDLAVDPLEKDYLRARLAALARLAGPG